MADAKFAKWTDQVKVTVPNAALFGADENETKELESWLALFEKELLPLIESNDKKLTPTLHKYNKALLSSTFFVSNHVTIADLVFYTKIHPIVLAWNEKDKLIFVNITRWIDHIQFLIGREKALAFVEVNPDCVPYEPRKQKEEQLKQQQAAQKKEAQQKKGGDKAPASKPAATEVIPENQDKREEKVETVQKKEEQGVVPPTEEKPAAPQEQKKEGKGKGKAEGDQQPKKPQANKGGKKPAAEPAPKLSATEDVSRLDIRVGLIKTCRKHENADSLYIEEIDVGEEAPRQVVSGLVKFVPLDQMQNRLVLLLCNLKPSNLKGVKSHAMVLAASNADHTQVELVDPPAGAKIGERVTFEGYSGDAEKALKNTTLDIVLPDLKSTGDLVATYKGVPFTTSAGVCKVKSIANGGIR